jgi:6-methylsalicylate decarboxylase
MMRQNNITTSIVSISSPGVLLKPDDTALAITLARKVNAYTAELKKSYPGKFGFFATLPLPDVDASLKEIETAYDEGADGIIFMSNYAGEYPTESKFARIWEELERRQAKVFFHPTQPCIRCSETTVWSGNSDSSKEPADRPIQETGLHVQKSNPFLGTFPAPMMEFLFDTARVGATLFQFGIRERYPSLTFLLPHSGGTLPPLFSRIVGFGSVVQAPGFPKRETPLSEQDAVKMLNERFYFDLAGWSFPMQWRMLVDAVGVKHDRLLFGTDYAFTPAPKAANFVRVMEEGMSGWTAENREKALSRNAKALFGLKD